MKQTLVIAMRPDVATFHAQERFPQLKSRVGTNEGDAGPVRVRVASYGDRLDGLMFDEILAYQTDYATPRQLADVRDRLRPGGSMWERRG